MLMSLLSIIYQASGLDPCEPLKDHLCAAVNNGFQKIFIANNSIAKLLEKPLLSVSVDTRPSVSVASVKRPELILNLKDKPTTTTKVIERPKVKVIITCPD